ncbi:hypothetical protein CPB86DRAFT_802113 [Serendipita vermifera]|nr:hypothetical protein CPB86DRAFT_802113 [Serendipita vermifera]
MSILVLKDTTVELSTRDDESLKGITPLILEVNVNGRVVVKANLLSQIPSPWKWDADQMVAIHDIATDFIISVVMESERNERRVIAFMELNGLEPWNTIGKQYEVPLMSDENYPNLVLRTSAMAIQNIEDFIARASLDDIGGGLPHTEGTIQKMLMDARAAYEDFQRHGKLERLEQAITQYRTVIEVIPEDDPKVLALLNDLGISLCRRFGQLGSLDDINEAIERLEMAILLTPDDDSNKPGRLTNLGGALTRRFERVGNLDDLDKAIQQQEAAVYITPDGDPNKPGRLNNLGVSLNNRFERLGRLNDIEDATIRLQQAFRKAVNLTPSEHPDKPLRLANLGACLGTRFKHFGILEDIDDAIVQLQMAVDLTPDNYPNKFRRFGNVTDLDDAIKNHEKALKLTPVTHSDRSSRLFNLALSYLDRFNLSPDASDAELAISNMSAAATLPNGPPAKRFNAADEWIKLASRIGHNSLLAAYGCALELMPFVAWLGLPIADRHQQLIKIGGIARDAAAAAISAEQSDKALEWLEQGRSIVWTQIIQLRTPVDDLREIDPKLADQLLRVSRLLDHGPQRTGFSDRGALSIEEEGRQYRALTAEWESIINQVRLLPSFKNFLRTPSLSQLTGTAHNGPVIIFNIAKIRCDALALLPELDDVIHILLPNITSGRITELRDELKDHLYSNGVRMRDTRAAMKFTDDSDEENCKQVLAELWNNLVKPVLDALAFSPHPDVLPRIWWCATGPLAFLPIHAAGIYGLESKDSQLSNYVISSYAPTLSTLLDPPKPPISSSFNLLSVIQPSAPGKAGTKKRVTKGMEECNWLHLACHGIQVQDEPTKSSLLLEDGRLMLEEIIKLDLPHAEFAFLSACQTTTGDESLSEEAVHIAGGMLLAGYRSVVATMWSIQDELAPMVTDEFYRHIMEGGGRPDPRKAAEALHMSVQKLRQQPGVQLTDWIPFVHLGV